MNNRTLETLVVSFLLTSLLACGRTSREGVGIDDTTTQAARIGRVEHGLVPAILIEDGPHWSLEERMAYYQVPGVSIAVVEDFELAWFKGYGVRAANRTEPVTPETLFQAASISKPVAAAAALQLVQSGALDLDTDVNRYLKSWKVPENEFTVDEKVTLRRLLSHSAGLTVRGFQGYPAGEPVPDILQVLDGREPANSDPVRVDQVPGSGYRYSGGGYTVLQLLLEEVSGRPLPDLVADTILEPAGMRHSSFRKPLPPELEQLTASGHDPEGTPFPGHTFLAGGSTCCGLWTTPADLARFALAIAAAANGSEGAILDQDLARAMITPAVDGRMGFGFQIMTRGGVTYFDHGGGNPGFACYLMLQPDEGYGAAIMTNSDTGHQMMGEILASIAREYTWESYLDPEYASLDDMFSQLRRLLRERPDDPRVAEARLNSRGYRLMRSGLTDWAVAVFRLNVELYPESSNVYDSLGEALHASGDLEGALESYRQSLTILEALPEKSDRDIASIDRTRQIIDRLQGESGG